MLRFPRTRKRGYGVEKAPASEGHPRSKSISPKGKTSPCNRSPANKTPKPSLSRSCPPKSAPRSEEDGHSSSSSSGAFIRPTLSGDSENLGSSLALATRALATDFRPRHLSEYPDTRRPNCLFTPIPPAGGWWAKFVQTAARTRMNFPILHRTRQEKVTGGRCLVQLFFR